jgi:hypothetical protein
MTEHGYEWIAQVRAQLGEMVSALADVTRRIGNEAQLKEIDTLHERISSDDFVVLVAGEFKTGKSTTINAMLGQKVLPAWAVPTTAVLCVVRWNETPVARLYELDPAKGSGHSDTFQEIPVQDLVKHVTIDELDPDKPSPWGLAEIDWPLPLCRNGVIVVDSPGLNEHQDRSRITTGYLGRADAVVFVFDATRALSASERDFLNLRIKAQGHEDVFFVCNRINQVDDEAEQERVRNRVLRVLDADWKPRENRVFFVNAKAALEERQRGETSMLESSGMPGFERQLEIFLSTERARLKVIPPAHQLQRLAGEARESIERQRVMLDRDVDDLRAAYERAQQPLQQLERERQLITRLIDQHVLETRAEVEESARRLLLSAADSCSRWAKEIERTHKIGLNPFTVNQQVEAAAKEISERLGARLQEAIAVWQREELMPLLDARMDDLQRDVDESLRSFFQRVEEVRLTFAPSAEVDTGEETPSATQRALAGIVGLALDPGSALVGSRFGFKKMLAGVLPQIGVAVVAVLIGFGPLAIFALLAGSGLIRALFGLNKANEQIVDRIANKIADEIRQTASEQSRKVAGEVQAQLDGIRAAVDENLGARLTGVREEVETVLRDLTRGRSHAAEVKERLALYQGRLKVIQDTVVDVITQFATLR